MKKILTLVVVGFVVFCGWLVAESGVDSRFRGNDKETVGQSCILLQRTTADTSDTANAPASKNVQLQAADFPALGADHAPVRSVILGASEPKTENADTGFKFQLELSSKGAAIRKATFSNGLDSRGKATGFDDRDYKDPQPLEILSPVKRGGGSEILSMANRELIFVEQQLQLRLDGLHWRSYGVERDYDGSQTARFEAIIKNENTGEPVVKLNKTYKLVPGSYLLDCDITVENLSAVEQKVRFNLTGPIGLGREGVRADMRKAVAGFRDPDGQITSERLDAKKLNRAKSVEDRKLTKPSADFLWAAAVNKYFAAILVPDPSFESRVTAYGRFYNPDGDERADTGDETVGLDLRIAENTLDPTSQAGSTKQYNFQLYLGPKDKSLFDKNELYRNLGFVHTITFMPCFCCPATIINPLAFGILTVMKWMYSLFGNYGVVIIILVLLMRLVIHPLTKKSQVSMGKMGKLAPKVEEVKKKYANNKAEMNKQVMALYKEQGASPIMGFLPMMVQMPIWIALWSAVYASIDLRGAAFLPFWITDLSVPDALVRFSTVTLPLLYWKIDSFNLLPILMGVAFYLQQKLMPKQAAAATNPQVAQQQKMMMIMMPLLFPLMLYKAPSGVNLYIMASTFAGVVEQHVIRKHVREKEERESIGLVAATSKTGGKVKKKKPKPFFRT